MGDSGWIEWNAGIIAEFRANAGKVGRQFSDVPLLLLHTVGARSGEPRVHPLAYQQLESGYAVFASCVGDPRNPSWYHNLRANPEVTIEVGTATLAARARVATGQERTRIWEKEKQDVPLFAEYDAKTDRTIPVIVLEPR